MDPTGDDRSARREARREELLARLREQLADRYELESVLEEGPVASIVQAREVKHGRPVALKILRPALSAAVEGQRFLREIEMIAGLSHPHILTLIDSGNVGGLYYYVVPHVGGESLRRRLARVRQLPVDEAISIAIDVADGLEHAHRRGIVHRDVNPATILLSEGHASISDFGVALATDSAGGERLTAVGVRLGTPAYASPEQLAGEAELGARADVYSLGCVLYEMLVGEPPMVGGSLEEMIRRRLRDDAPSARDLRSTVPAGLDEVLRTALARLPADRFATAAEFREALRDVVGGGRPVARGAPAPPDGRRLAAILSLDTVGYTRLVERDETGTLARLRRIRTELLEPRIAAHRGRVVKGTGDGVLAEFTSAVDAVECAQAIQTAMRGIEAGMPEEQRIRFRIGIHVGDVVAEAGDIFGDGVNIAARVEGLAEPGGIALSATAWDPVHTKLALRFEDLGPQRIRNLERPIHVYRVAADRDPAVPPGESAAGGLRGLLVRALRPRSAR